MDPNETATKRAQTRQGLLLRDKWRIDRLLDSDPILQLNPNQLALQWS